MGIVESHPVRAEYTPLCMAIHTAVGLLALIQYALQASHPLPVSQASKKFSATLVIDVISLTFLARILQQKPLLS